MVIRVFAPAKINLALHVTGRRADGYHLLESLVAFASCGDWITVQPAESLSLTLTGPQAGDLSNTDNLVLKAARALHPARGAHITLDKRLPVASGIGGGSADAAATATDAAATATDAAATATDAAAMATDAAPAADASAMAADGAMAADAAATATDAAADATTAAADAGAAATDAAASADAAATDAKK